MELWQFVGVALTSAILIVYLKNTRPELAMAATVAAGAVLLVLALGAVRDIVESLNSLAVLTNIDSTMLVIIIKITGISYLIEFAATTIEDFGSKSVADKVLFGGKVLILSLSLPIIKSLIELIASIVSGGGI